MIRRKAKRESALSAYKQAAPFSIGPTRADEKAAARTHRAAVIAQVRQAVFARDRWCRSCGAPARRDDEMHELRSRAQLRGKAPEDVFNTRNCVRLCGKCHPQVTRHEIVLEVRRPEYGADGPVDARRIARAASRGTATSLGSAAGPGLAPHDDRAGRRGTARS